jgi:predicted Zn-ribbon and HTH transcriptional regulator
MSKKEIRVYKCRCERCGHEWITRNEGAPVVCPKCKSPYWDKPPNKNNGGR